MAAVESAAAFACADELPTEPAPLNQPSDHGLGWFTFSNTEELFKISKTPNVAYGVMIPAPLQGLSLPCAASVKAYATGFHCCE